MSSEPPRVGPCMRSMRAGCPARHARHLRWPS
jgi:hypothetical protein